MSPSPLSLRAFVHRFLVALVIGAVLTTALLVGVNVVGTAKVSNIHKQAIDPSLLAKGGNYLIIGSDTRAFIDSQADTQHFGSKQSQTGQRSDTIMVAHIDPGKHTGVLVSFPRDLWVAIPGHGSAKINAAFAFGGPQLTIATIKQDFNIPISHFLEVDFAGFRDIVNAIGTVPIFFPASARDTNTGLLQGAGCEHLAGDQALAYVRSRYYQYQTADGQWHYDPTSDIGRIQRQQYFIRSLSRAAIKTVFPNPFKFSKVIDKTVASLTSDQKFGSSDLRALARAFRNTDPLAFPMYTLPATNAFRDGQSVLLLEDSVAAPTLARLRNAPKKQSEPVPKISPATVRVTVENGSGVTGAATRARSDLGAAGFALGGSAADADRSDYTTTEVRYGPGGRTKAQLVLAYLGGAGKLVALGTAPSGEDVIVVLGRDFQQVTAPTTSTTTAPAPHAGSGSTTTTGPPANPGGAMPEAGC